MQEAQTNVQIKQELQIPYIYAKHIHAVREMKPGSQNIPNQQIGIYSLDASHVGHSAYNPLCEPISPVESEPQDLIDKINPKQASSLHAVYSTLSYTHGSSPVILKEPLKEVSARQQKDERSKALLNRTGAHVTDSEHLSTTCTLTEHEFIQCQNLGGVCNHYNPLCEPISPVHCIPQDNIDEQIAGQAHNMDTMDSILSTDFNKSSSITMGKDVRKAPARWRNEDPEYLTTFSKIPETELQHKEYVIDKTRFCRENESIAPINLDLNAQRSSTLLQCQNLDRNNCKFLKSSTDVGTVPVNKTQKKISIYSCRMPDCGEIFKSKQSLYGHMNLHNMIFVYDCEFWQKEFERYGRLKKHQRTHIEHSHSETSPLLSLSLGEGLSFENVQDTCQESKAQICNGDRKKIGSIVEKSKIDQTRLYRENERVACANIDPNAQRPSTMQCQNLDRNNYMMLKSSAGIEIVRVNKNRKKIYSCPVPNCGTICKNRQTLYHHMNSHSMIFVCGQEFCQKEFECYRRLRRHQRTHFGKSRSETSPLLSSSLGEGLSSENVQYTRQESKEQDSTGTGDRKICSNFDKKVEDSLPLKSSLITASSLKAAELSPAQSKHPETAIGSIWEANHYQWWLKFTTLPRQMETRCSLPPLYRILSQRVPK